MQLFKQNLFKTATILGNFFKKLLQKVKNEKIKLLWSSELRSHINCYEIILKILASIHYISINNNTITSHIEIEIKFLYLRRVVEFIGRKRVIKVYRENKSYITRVRVITSIIARVMAIISALNTCDFMLGEEYNYKELYIKWP